LDEAYSRRKVIHRDAMRHRRLTDEEASMQLRMDILAAKYDALKTVCDKVYTLAQGMVRLAQALPCPSQPLRLLDTDTIDFVQFVALSIYEEALFENRFAADATRAGDMIRSWCEKSIPGLTASVLRSIRSKVAAMT
jgi:hypothetical protein